MQISTVCMFCFLGGVPSLSAEEVFVSNLDLSKAYQQYGLLMKGQSVTGEKALSGGEAFDDVIGVQSKSRIRINLKKESIRFDTSIALADTRINTTDPSVTSIPLGDGKRVFYREINGEKVFAGLEGSDGKVDSGTAVFKIFGDGRELFSKAISHGAKAEKVSLDVLGIAVLELVVDEGEDGPSGDHALWIHPTIKYQKIPPAVVDMDFVWAEPGVSTDIQDELIAKAKQLPEVTFPMPVTDFDWLISPEKSKAFVGFSDDGKSLVLANNMVARVFRLVPNLATTDFINRMSGETMLRAVSSEGSVSIDGTTWSLGGLAEQPERAYIKPAWIEEMKAFADSFTVEDFDIQPITDNILWPRKRWALNKKSPEGIVLSFTLKAKQLTAILHYAIYDNLPVIRKSFEIINNGDNPINIDSFKLEQLSFMEPESPVELTNPRDFMTPNIHIESDYAFHGFTEKESEKTENWVIDPDYSSQCNYPRVTPCILEVKPPLGPDMEIAQGETFTTFNVYEMPLDSFDRERQGLFKRRMHCVIAPWITENPIFLHLTSTDPNVVKRAVDQCAEVGYEMIILSFGSGLDMENTSEENYKKFREFVQYANSKGIEIGGYSLLSSRWISDDVDVINPQTGKRGGMIFGSSPCLCSDWGYEYFDKIQTFFEKTGMAVFEHDGSYPGNVCASTKHSHHKGLNDSQWKQFFKIKEFYKWMCEKGIYMNVPDFYLLNGTTKVGIGYRETNWSLPRERQVIHGRQVNFSGTWDRPASACWTFVPLVQYHGGGAAATLEPLSEHLDFYKAHMFQNYGAGVQACYRGPRLYDTPETEVAVKEVIDWYKKYRNILNSDIIHLRRADARDWDGILHVNPKEKEKGLALFFNPLDKEITRTIKLPLYYTGLTQKALVREQEKQSVVYTLNRDYSIDLTIKLPPNGYTWYVIEQQ